MQTKILYSLYIVTLVTVCFVKPVKLATTAATTTEFDYGPTTEFDYGDNSTEMVTTLIDDVGTTETILSGSSSTTDTDMASTRSDPSSTTCNKGSQLSSASKTTVLALVLTMSLM
ncbi:hypothetical protein DPMN_123954 [Dreissena polymorpha]|uniref:Uncharacterized protein n=1 Tax=Dreissena polymorpha TaxID=45954 RepID=A0A9D4GYI3_DREPO|nr:hypothetical protein DPMN_123954 [Dreissena polymorpha]